MEKLKKHLKKYWLWYSIALVAIILIWRNWDKILDALGIKKKIDIDNSIAMGYTLPEGLKMNEPINKGDNNEYTLELAKILGSYYVVSNQCVTEAVPQSILDQYPLRGEWWTLQNTTGVHSGYDESMHQFIAFKNRPKTGQTQPISYDLNSTSITLSKALELVKNTCS